MEIGSMEAITMELDIPIKVVGKERPRFNYAFKYAYTPRKTTDFEGKIAAHFDVYMKSLGLKAIEGPVRADVIFYIKVPKSWSKKKHYDALAKKLRPTKTPDVDNALKAVFDGLNNVAYLDDKQIVSGSFDKFYDIVDSINIKINEIKK